MKLRCFSMPLASGVCVVSLVPGAAAGASDVDLGMLAASARAAMQENQWDSALALHNQLVTSYGKNQPLQTFGPQFGAIYYHKGICEMKLKRWDEAMRSFEICYRDFPNASPTAGGGNIFQKMALLKWGEAAMGAQNWQLAISRFQKFLTERDRDQDLFAQGPFHVGMAVCQYRLGRIPEGNESLEISIRNKHGFPTPDNGIVAGIQELVSAVIASRNEQALLDFIEKNRSDLVTQPYAMHQFSPVYLKLAGDTLAADMPRAAMALYQFVPSSVAVMNDIRARLKSMGSHEIVENGADPPFKKQLEADLAELESDRAGKHSAEMIKLAGIALIHEKNGNPQGAYAACIEVAVPLLEMLEPGSPEHDLCLFSLGASWFHAGRFDKAQAPLDQHVALYPQSKFALPAAYFRAANACRQQDWGRATRLLDGFLTSFPDAAGNIFLPYALCDRAACHFAGKKPENALADLDRVITDFPDCQVIDEARQLKAKIKASDAKLPP